MAIAGLEQASPLLLGESQSIRTSSVLRMWQELEEANQIAKNDPSSSYRRRGIHSNADNGAEKHRTDYDEGIVSSESASNRPKINGVRRPIISRMIGGRQTLVDLLSKAHRERRDELRVLSERKSVSEFAHRRRIKALLRGRFLTNGRFVLEKRTNTESDFLRRRQTVSDLREEFISKLGSSSGSSSSSTSSRKNDNNGDSESICITADSNPTEEEEEEEEEESLSGSSSNEPSIEQSSNEDLHGRDDDAIDPWIPQMATMPSSSSSHGEVGRFHSYHKDDENEERRMEVRELSSRRRVSSLLGSSSFSDSLNQVLQSHIERQAHHHHNHHHQSDDYYFYWEEDEEEDPQLRYQDLEVINDKMQTMIENCMDYQVDLQSSLGQEELSSAMDRSILTRENLEDIYLEQVKKGICCLCADAKISTLLYRCGHVCTCFDCAQRLVRANGRCPICLCPIAEAVPVHFIQ